MGILNQMLTMFDGILFLQSKLPAVEEANLPEILLCEGYITKIRGIGRTRSRFFRLTTKTFSFYSEEAVGAMS